MQVAQYFLFLILIFILQTQGPYHKQGNSNNTYMINCSTVQSRH